MGETVSAILSSARTLRADPALYVGLAGDAPRTPGIRYSLAGIDRVDLVRGEARSATRRSADGIQLLVVALGDTRLSSQHARITRLGKAWFVEDLQSKNGTWIDGRNIARHELG